MGQLLKLKIKRRLFSISVHSFITISHLVTRKSLNHHRSISLSGKGNPYLYKKSEEKKISKTGSSDIVTQSSQSFKQQNKQPHD